MLTSFSYVARADATALILGSMPGKVSLTHQQYYAHPRNAFWPIMAHCFGFEHTALNYLQRLEQVKSHHVALWDVMRHCERASSLDSDIVENSIVVNDFHHFLTCHPHIKHICFNGKAAEKSFIKYALPTLLKHRNFDISSITLSLLPSTSPAHASMNLEQKKHIWQQVLSSKNEE